MSSRRERKAARARARGPDAGRGHGQARMLLVGAIVAAVVGFGAGWLVRIWTDDTPEERAREAVGEVRERARELTR